MLHPFSPASILSLEPPLFPGPPSLPHLPFSLLPFPASLLCRQALAHCSAFRPPTCSFRSHITPRWLEESTMPHGLRSWLHFCPRLMGQHSSIQLVTALLPPAPWRPPTVPSLGRETEIPKAGVLVFLPLLRPNNSHPHPKWGNISLDFRLEVSPGAGQTDMPHLHSSSVPRPLPFGAWRDGGCDTETNDSIVSSV